MKDKWINVIVTLSIAYLISVFFTPTDDSDVDKWNRSGMSLHRDALTGCEYFSTLFGGPTPRLDKDGTPICKS